MINTDYKLAKRVIYTLLVSSGLFVLLFSVISFDQTIAANGKIVADEKLIFMQAQYTATIKHIFVKRGQYVQKNQALLSLDNTLNYLQTDKMTAELTVINNKIDNLSAEIIFLKENKILSKPDYDQSHLHSLKLHIHDSEQTIQFMRQEQLLQLNHLQLIRWQIKDAEKLNLMHEKLYLKKFVSLQQLLTSRQKLRLDQMQLITEKMAYHKLTANIAEKISLLNEFKSEQLAELNQKIVDLKQQQKRLKISLETNRFLASQSILPAPVSGYILAITELAPGSSLSSGQTYIQIAPLAALQYAEVYLTSDQIGWIKPSHTAVLTLNALSTQHHVDLSASIINIAPQPVKMKNNDYYIVQVKIPAAQLKKLPPQFNLQAGMQVRVYFKVGKMRLINYFIYPMWQQIKEL